MSQQTLHLTRNTVYQGSQSPKAKLTLGSTLISLFLIHLLISSSLFLILYPIKASCLLSHFAILWNLGNRDCLLHELLNKVFASPELSSFFFFLIFIYLFGCTESLVQHAGSSLPRVGSLVAAFKLLVAACEV